MAAQPEPSPAPDPLAVSVVAALRERGETLATSESLTGGLLGASLTSVPGASEVYLGGAIAYATPMKTVLSGVDPALVERHGVISGEVAAALAAGIRDVTGADWALGVSGVAGPSAQEGHAPGEVWIGLAGPGIEAGGVRADFSGDRTQVRAQTVAAALARLLSMLAGPAQSS